MRSTLILQPGKYYFERFTVEPQATILLAAGAEPVQIFVRTEFVWRGKVVDMDHADFPDWMIGVMGSLRVPVEAQFKGLLVAPNAEVTLARVDPGKHEGQFFGRTVEVHPDTRIVYHTTEFMKDPPTGKILFDASEDAPGCGTTLQLTGRSVNASGFVKHSSVSQVAPQPGCPTVQFCDGAFGRGSPIDVKDRIDHPPFNRNTELVACQNEDRKSTSECPVDPHTIDYASACNSDTDCPAYRTGQICASLCDTAECKSTTRHCAKTHQCNGLDVDPRGCAPSDIWQCAPPQAETTAAQVSSQITVRTTGATVSESEKLAAPGYLQVTETMNPCRDPRGQVDIEEGDDHEPSADDSVETASASADSINPIVLGNDQFGLFIIPQLYHSANITPGRLDLFDAGVSAKGSMVAGATVFGESITALTMEAHGEAGLCGFNAGATIVFFGDEVAGFQARLTSPPLKTLCTDNFRDIKELAKAVEQKMLNARRFIKIYENHPNDTTLLCNEAEALFESPLEGNQYTCLSGSPQAVVNMVIQRFRDEMSTFIQDRVAFLRSAIATGSGGLQEYAVPLVATPFDVLGVHSVIPIGPLALVIDVQLGGQWGVDGTLSYGAEWPELGSNQQLLGEPKFSGGAATTPYIHIEAEIYAGAGIDLGFAGASVGLAGTLTLIDVRVPVGVKMSVFRETLDEKSVTTRDFQNSDFAGTPYAGLPVGKVYRWKGQARFGADLVLSSLSGFLDAAARVHFLFFSETFRARITDWKGFTKTFPLATATADAGLEFGLMADPVAYTYLDDVGNGQRQIYTPPADFNVETSQCTPVDVVK